MDRSPLPPGEPAILVVLMGLWLSLGVWHHRKRTRQDREAFSRWLSDHGYRVVALSPSAGMPFAAMPWTLTSGAGGVPYRLEAEGALGKRRNGWIRTRGAIWASGVEVVWDR